MKLIMTHEEILQKYLKGERPVEDSKLLGAVILATANSIKEVAKLSKQIAAEMRAVQ
jgi:hypothetical protein